jgi:putative transposase
LNLDCVEFLLHLARMPRRIFEVSTDNPYHVTGRCLNREWFAVPMPTVWAILCESLFLVNQSYDLQIHSFVLMGNHFHLLVSTPTGSLSHAMKYFMSQTSKILAYEANRINHIWGARFHRCEITNHHYFLNAYKYNYRNPVAANIVQKVEAYPYSTLQGLLGQGHLTIPLIEDVTLFSDVEGTLDWLNTTVTPENTEAVRKALRRKVFKFPKIDSRPHPLEIDLL